MKLKKSKTLAWILTIWSTISIIGIALLITETGPTPTKILSIVYGIMVISQSIQTIKQN